MSILRKWLARPDQSSIPALVVRKVDVRREHLRLTCAPVAADERELTLSRVSATLVWRSRPGAPDETQPCPLERARPRDGQDGQLLLDIAAPRAGAQWVSLRFDGVEPGALDLPEALRLQLAHLLPPPGEWFQAVFACRAVRIGGIDTQATLARQIVDDPGRPLGERLVAATVQLYKAMESVPEQAWARGLEAFAAVQADVEAALSQARIDTPVLMLMLAHAQWLLGHAEPGEARQELLDLLTLADRAADPMTSAECFSRAALIAGMLQARDAEPAQAVPTLRRIPRLFRQAVDVADPSRLREFENMRKLLQCATTAGHLWREIQRPTGQLDRVCSRALEVGFNVAGKHRDAVFRRLALPQIPAPRPERT